MRRERNHLGLVALAASVAIWAIVTLALASTGTGSSPEPAASSDIPTLDPRLPTPPGPLAPSFLRPSAGEELDADRLADTETCERCHADITREWRSSAHAWASFNNPWYRTSVDRFRETTGREPSRFCGGCHDLALLPGGGLDGEVAPGDPLAFAGVGCLGCHGVRGLAPDGNASLTLSTAAVPLPVALPSAEVGDNADPDAFEPYSLRRHRDHVGSDLLHSDDLCVACHRGFLGPETGNPHHLVGIDDATDWQRSLQGETGIERVDEVVAAQGCRDCHMGTTDGHASHRFPGSHTALAAAINDADQQRVTEDLLWSAATVDIAAVRHEGNRWSLPAESARLEEGERIWLDVVVRNVGAAHRFPGGTLDLQDTWLELEVRDASGRLLAEAGTQHASTGSDPTAHVLSALPIDESGQHEPHHVVSNMRTVAWNHTIPPRDAIVARYAWQVPSAPPEPAGPYQVTARLRHRRHHLRFAEAACEAGRSERGRAFATASEHLELPVADPCEPLPITDLAETTVLLGDAASASESPDSSSGRSLWRRHYDHALGLVHQVGERDDEARPSLEAAWRAVEASGTDRQRAMVLVLMAELEGGLGRVEPALELLDRAESLLPGHPAIAFRRGEALAAVWRWPEAAASYQIVAERVPESDIAWQRLAQALVSDAQFEPALAAAHEGLRLQPRDPSLLLSQYLALDALNAAEPAIEAARAAFLAHRPPDEAPAIRYTCFREVPGCADERLPVTVREMRRPSVE